MSVKLSGFFTALLTPFAADGGIGSTYNFMAEKFIKIEKPFRKLSAEEEEILISVYKENV